MKSPNYAFTNHAFVAREASRVLQEQRYERIYDNHKRKDKRIIPFPDCTKGKQKTTARGPRLTIKHRPSRLSHEIDSNTIDDVCEEDFEEMQAYYRELCERYDGKNEVNFNDVTYTAGFTEEEVEPDAEVTGLSMGEPDDYDIEMAKAEGEDVESDTEVTGSLMREPDDYDIEMAKVEEEEVEPDAEITGSSMEEPDDYDIEMAKAEEEGLFEALQEADQSTELSIPDPIPAEDAGKQTKRKRESDFPPELPTVDLPGHDDRDQKRRKLEEDIESFQIPPPGVRKKMRRQGRGKLEPHHLFCRSSSLAAVFEAAVAVGALEAPQRDSSDTSELDTVDLELLERRI